MAEKIKVRATDVGVYGHYRNPGDEFFIDDEKAFSARWMEPIGELIPKAVEEKFKIKKNKETKGKEALIKKFGDKQPHLVTPKGVPPGPVAKNPAPLPEDVI